MFRTYRVTYRSGSRRIAVYVHDACTRVEAAQRGARRIAATAMLPIDSLHLVAVIDV